MMTVPMVIDRGRRRRGRLRDWKVLTPPGLRLGLLS
jgi:hypothetical protein